MKTKESIGKKLVSDMIEDIMYGWPPDCVGILYQPERPRQKYKGDVPNDNAAEDNER